MPISEHFCGFSHIPLCIKVCIRLWKGLPYLIQCIPFVPPAYPLFPLFLGQKWANCVKHWKIRGKGLPYLVHFTQ